MPGIEVAKDDLISSNVTAESYMSSTHSKTETLCTWIRSVRNKQKRVRKQKKSELRRMAILALALRRAEDELMSKQRARAQRWAELQQSLSTKKTEETKSKMEVDDWWQSELKDLDNFLSNLSNFKSVDANR